MNGCTIDSNEGGGINAYDYSSYYCDYDGCYGLRGGLTMQNCTIRGNTGGGGIVQRGGSYGMSINNSTIVGNSGTGAYDAGVYARSSLKAQSSIFANNSGFDIYLSQSQMKRCRQPGGVHQSHQFAGCHSAGARCDCFQLQPASCAAGLSRRDHTHACVCWQTVRQSTWATTAFPSRPINAARRANRLRGNPTSARTSDKPNDDEIFLRRSQRRPLAAARGVLLQRIGQNEPTHSAMPTQVLLRNAANLPRRDESKRSRHPSGNRLR